jgi:RNA polymerase sigma-70 factor (sigma-E family)
VAAPDGFTEFATAHAAKLRRTAFLLCGDWHTAQDLTQTTLTSLFVAWKRVSATTSVYAYAHRTLLNAYLSQRRRRSSTEVPTDVLPDHARPDRGPEVGMVLRDALATLGPRARAVVVLRYWADLSVDDVAAMLDMTAGNVRVQASRALDQLRAVLGEAHVDLVNSF